MTVDGDDQVLILMKKKTMAVAHRLNATFNCSQAQEGTLSCISAHMHTDDVLETDHPDNILKIKPSQRGSFVDPTLPKIAHQRGASCTRMPQSDLFKTPGNLQRARISTLFLYLLYFEAKETY